MSDLFCERCGKSPDACHCEDHDGPRFRPADAPRVPSESVKLDRALHAIELADGHLRRALDCHMSEVAEIWVETARRSLRNLDN